MMKKVWQCWAVLCALVMVMVLAFVGCNQPTDNGKPATTYTVTFDLNYEGATGTPAEQTITEGQKAVEPEPTPVRDGHTFVGWYTEAACTNKWDFTENMVMNYQPLFAKWTKKSTYTVTFDLNYFRATGTPAEQIITKEQKAEEPTTPTKENDLFKGWYTEAACTNKWDFASNTVTENKTLYAKWEYAVGSTGPAGGIIFYVNTDAAIGDWTYLEAAPADLEDQFKWDREFRPAPVITSNAIGSGAANTAEIIAALEDKSEAANATDEYEYGGKNDWFLPSKDELNLMYQNLKEKNLASFQDGMYWSSSSQEGVVGAWSQDFRDGEQYNGSSNNIQCFIRVVRSF